MAKPVEVGAWVRDPMTGWEGLVIAFDPLTKFFTVERENGQIWADDGRYLEVIE